MVRASVLVLALSLQLFSLLVQVWGPPQVLVLELEVLAWRWQVPALSQQAQVYGLLVLFFLVLAFLLPVQA